MHMYIIQYLGGWAVPWGNYGDDRFGAALLRLGPMPAGLKGDAVGEPWLLLALSRDESPVGSQRFGWLQKEPRWQDRGTWDVLGFVGMCWDRGWTGTSNDLDFGSNFHILGCSETMAHSRIYYKTDALTVTLRPGCACTSDGVTPRVTPKVPVWLQVCGAAQSHQHGGTAELGKHDWTGCWWTPLWLPETRPNVNDYVLFWFLWSGWGWVKAKCSIFAGEPLASNFGDQGRSFGQHPPQETDQTFAIRPAPGNWLEWLQVPPENQTTLEPERHWVCHRKNPLNTLVG